MYNRLYELEWQYKLVMLRQQHKLTMQQASEKLKQDKYFVEQLENGFIPLTEENVKLVLSLYHMSFEEFIKWRPKEFLYPEHMPPKNITKQASQKDVRSQTHKGENV